MFGCLLGPRSFDSLKGLIACKQTFFQITLGGITLISTSTITMTTYLWSWAFVALILNVIFMFNQRPFLLEALVRIHNNTFIFQQHLKARCDLLPPPAWTCLLPFEELIKQQMVHFQDSISKRLHHHTLSNLFFYKAFEAHCACILSCSNLGVGVWLVA
jgi:hypothetical protein